MKRSFTLILSSLAFTSLLLFSACFSPRPIIRMEPLAEDVRWDYGVAFGQQVSDLYDVRAAYVDHDRDMLFFDIMVFNNSEEDILISPEEIYLETMHGGRNHALDPEANILGMDLEQSRKEANRKNMAVVAGVAAVGTAIAVATSDNGNNNDDAVQALDGASYGLDIFIDLSSLLTYNLGDTYYAPPLLPEEGLPSKDARVFWTDYTLRRTTLAPGDSVRGIIVIRRMDALEQLNLNIPVGVEDFQFDFRQRLIRP